MIQLLVIIVLSHIFHGNELLDPGHDGFDLARESGETDHFLEQIVLLEGLSSFHHLYDSRIDAVLSILKNLVMDSLGILSRLLLLDGIDLDSSELGSEVQVYLELVLLRDILFDDFGFLLHQSWDLFL